MSAKATETSRATLDFRGTARAEPKPRAGRGEQKQLRSSRQPRWTFLPSAKHYRSSNRRTIDPSGGEFEKKTVTPHRHRQSILAPSTPPGLHASHEPVPIGEALGCSRITVTSTVVVASRRSEAPDYRALRD
ncbi:2-dehydropantoate 2-reductase [Anopheles sinensis]|uniref:2-dehydropantoate 2-reductase n=1 Tax=Anopheles sinensis TaxID=74873 RepID=A0A084WTH1_ANOSI|nr:2-dehydropantoate 2-reductase [Anopheles sinensis]